MKKLFSLFLLACAQPVLAWDAGRCVFDSWPSLTAAIDQSSIELAVLDEEKKANESSAAVLGLSPASVLSGDFYKGLKRAGDGEIEASYIFVWERAQKISSRKRVASEALLLIEARRDFIRAKSRVELVLALHKMRHNQQEAETLAETRDTYHRLVKKLKALPILSPEQALTLSVFQMAADESSTQIANLKGEEAVFRSTLMRLTACIAPKINFSLDLTRASAFPPLSLLEAAKADPVVENERRVAKAQWESAKAAAETDLSIGPIVKIERQDRESNLSAGLAISVPIGRERQTYEVAEAQALYRAKSAEIDLKQKLLDNEKARWLAQYQSARSGLRTNLNLSEIQKKHRGMESLFSSGRVNASLIIEAHRQIIESLNARHELESQALESLWNIYLLSGNIFEVTAE